MEAENRLYMTIDNLTGGRSVKPALDVLHALADAFAVADALERRGMARPTDEFSGSRP